MGARRSRVLVALGVLGFICYAGFGIEIHEGTPENLLVLVDDTARTFQTVRCGLSVTLPQLAEYSSLPRTLTIREARALPLSAG